LKKKIIVGLIILVFPGLIFAILQLNKTGLANYLEKSHPVEADMLIIESWLPDSAIAMSMSEIRKDDYDFIVTTGIESSELDFCMVAMNGYLIFYPNFKSGTGKETGNHSIEVLAHSKMGGKYCSHFNFYVNDSLLTDFNADEEPGKYKVIWEKPLTEIDSLMIEFTNDYFDDQGDRNLYIKEIIIDSDITIPYQFNSVFDIGLLGGNDRNINNYRSHPEIIRNKLIKYGIDSSKIVAVTGKKTNVNRTLTGALAFRDWLKTSGQQVKGINIITMGIHSRRTWLTYKRLLDRSINIGIISLPESENPELEKSEFVRTITETLDLIYYWIITIPY
jgi:hypothetical protein